MRFPEDLPISAHVVEIAKAVDASPVVIVAGETGSGKSTQLPKICLAMGRGVTRRIGVTQPRRIAATSIAARVASELGVELGREVGYQIRFSDRTGPHTYVKVMTDGILLAEMQGDPLLRATTPSSSTRPTSAASTSTSSSATSSASSPNGPISASSSAAPPSR